MTPTINIYNEDSLQAMRAMRDKQFDLAIVDPPYGINLAKWDIRPPDEYWQQLFRISQNQIVWGGNYFADKLPIRESWICWWKKPFLPQQAHFELAWTSFDIKPILIEYTYAGNAEGIKNVRVDYTKKSIHPAQKPDNIYRILLQKFVPIGSKIIDTHMGSGSIAIACYDEGYDLEAYEIDKEYYEMACKRLDNHKRQLQLWR